VDDFDSGAAPVFFSSRTNGTIDFTRRAPKNFINRCVKFMFDTFWKKDSTGWTGYSLRRGAITHLADSGSMQTNDLESAAGWRRGSRQLDEYRQTSVAQLHLKSNILSTGPGAQFAARQAAAALVPVPPSSVPPTPSSPELRPSPTAAPLLPPRAELRPSPAAPALAAPAPSAALRKAQQAFEKIS